MGYTIALLDDDLNDIKFIESELKLYSDFKTYAYTSIEALLTSNNEFDVLFLDIEMPQMNGIQLAEKIRELKEVPIIFMSWHEGYVFQTFSIHPLYFIRKASIKTDLPLCMQEIKIALSVDQMFEFVSEYQKYVVDISEITFFEVKERKTYIHRAYKDLIYCWIPLKQIQKEKKFKNFVLMNQSCLVNIAYVEKLDEFSCVLLTKEQIDVSYRKRKNLEKALLNYKKYGDVQ